MLNRTLVPETKLTQHIDFVEPTIHSLNSNSSLFVLDKVKDETFRLELHFNAGQIHGEKSIASFVNALLLSGTAQKNSRQIQEELDYLGAYVDHEISMESAFISLFCLKKNAKAAIALLMDAFENVSFEEHEIQDMLKEKKQRFLVSCEKVNFLARKAFQTHFFASNEAYGREVFASDFDHVDRNKLIQFHQTNYLKGLRKAVLVGNVDQDSVAFIVERIKAFAQSTLPAFEQHFTNHVGRFKVEKKEALQTAIRMGWLLFNKKHPDYTKFQVLQTILGDYFGSRLMSNIREDKGYTYGIGCALVELKETGYFIIATEVGKDVTEATLHEIDYEIKRLQSELVPEEELNLVKNYMLGQLLKSADGPNAMMDLFLGVQQHGLSVEFYNQYIQEILATTAEDLKRLATQHLDLSKLTTITAGEHN